MADLNKHHANALEGIQAGAMAKMSEGAEQFKARLIVANAMPRDLEICIIRLNQSLMRPGFAKDVTYRFPRGGSEISGPSVYLAREFARCFGNFDAGVNIISVDDEQVHIEGFCMDLETNYRIVSQAKFKSLIQRKKGGATHWVKPDERDLRELINKHGAVAMRNAILQCIPPDLVEEAIATATDTLEKGVKPEDYDKAIEWYEKKQLVPLEELEKFLGVKRNEWGPQHLIRLRQVRKTIEDGYAQVAEFFFKGDSGKAEEAEVSVGDIEAEADQDKRDGDLFDHGGTTSREPGEEG